MIGWQIRETNGAIKRNRADKTVVGFEVKPGCTKGAGLVYHEAYQTAPNTLAAAFLSNRHLRQFEFVVVQPQKCAAADYLSELRIFGEEDVPTGRKNVRFRIAERGEILFFD
jgi:hypothetical protein